MYGQCEIVNSNKSVLESPQVKHYSDLSELNDVAEKCKSLSERAMKSSIHSATSIAHIHSLLKTDISSILNVMDNMKFDCESMQQEISLLVAHVAKMNATLYDIQDLVKDKLKSYDETFEVMIKKLNEHGDIIKETNRQVLHINEIDKPIPKPKPLLKRSIQPSVTKK